MKLIHVFSTACLTLLLSQSLYSQSTCSPSAYYCFTNSAIDGSGNGFDATVSQANLTSGREGVENTAYRFNHANAEITFSTDSLRSNTFTYAAWVMPSQLPANNMTWGAHSIVSIGNVGGDQFLHLANRGANGVGFCLVSWSVGPVKETVCTGTLPAVNKWYHVAGIRTVDSIKIFVDGKLMGSKALQVSTPVYPSSTIGVIGSRGQNLTPWKGKIDEVALFNCALSNAEIADLYSSNSYCQEEDQCDSDLFYCFDGDAQDQSGNGFHGTPTQNVTDVVGRDGVVNSAYEFSGNMSFITFPADSLSSNTFSYSAWVNPSQIPAYDPLWGTHGIVNIGNTAGDHYLHLANKGQNGTGFCLISWSKGPVKETVCSGTLPSTNQWYHVTGIRTVDSMKLYVNGVLEGSEVLNVREPSFTTPVEGMIGSRHDTATFWKGKIDEVAVFNCAISPSKVNDLFNANPYCSESTSTEPVTKASSSGFIIYPNPSNGQIRIGFMKGSVGDEVTFELFDIKGQQLFSTHQALATGNDRIELDYSSIGSGTYFLRVTSGNQVAVKRVVIQ